MMMMMWHLSVRARAGGGSPVVRRRLCSLAGVHNAFHNYIYRLVKVACRRHAVHLMPDDMGLT